MEKQFEEIIYSRYQTRIRDMKMSKVDEGFEQILGLFCGRVEHITAHVKDIMLGKIGRIIQRSSMQRWRAGEKHIWDIG